MIFLIYISSVLNDIFTEKLSIMSTSIINTIRVYERKGVDDANLIGDLSDKNENILKLIKPIC